MHMLHCLLIDLNDVYYNEDYSKIISSKTINKKDIDKIRVFAASQIEYFEHRCFDWFDFDGAGRWKEYIPENEGIVFGFQDPEKFEKMLRYHSSRPFMEAFDIYANFEFEQKYLKGNEIKELVDKNIYLPIDVSSINLLLLPESTVDNSGDIIDRENQFILIGLDDFKQIDYNSIKDDIIYKLIFPFKKPENIKFDLKNLTIENMMKNAYELYMKKTIELIDDIKINKDNLYHFMNQYAILRLVKLLLGEYMFDSGFYNTIRETTTIFKEEFQEILNNKKRYALVFFDYHY